MNKMAVSRERKLKIERYLFKNCKMGDFNSWRTFLEPQFIIPESSVEPRAVVFAQIMNEQTNKQTNKLNYIYRCRYVMHNIMFRNYSFSFERNGPKCGRSIDRRSKGTSNMSKTKLGLFLFHLNSCTFTVTTMSRAREKIVFLVQKLLLQF